jgi:hypothetical protein
MIPPDELREAARRMRVLAEAALKSAEQRWLVDQSPDYGLTVGAYMPDDIDHESGYVSTAIVAQFAYGDDADNKTYANALPTATHIAAWQPSVALAIAALLDAVEDEMFAEAHRFETGDFPYTWTAALAVARAFLGGAQ